VHPTPPLPGKRPAYWVGPRPAGGPAVTAQEGDVGWRVVLTLADDVGNRWPVVVWVEPGEEAGGE